MNWLLLTQRLVLRHDGDVMLQLLCNRVVGATVLYVMYEKLGRKENS